MAKKRTIAYHNSFKNHDLSLMKEQMSHNAYVFGFYFLMPNSAIKVRYLAMSHLFK